MKMSKTRPTFCNYGVFIVPITASFLLASESVRPSFKKLRPMNVLPAIVTKDPKAVVFVAFPLKPGGIAYYYVCG